MNKFYQYIMGRKLTLYSNHKSLASIFRERKVIPGMRIQEDNIGGGQHIFLVDYAFKHISSS